MRKNKLLPVVIQDNKTNEVLMLAYMNNDALEKTKQTGFVYFWSRKRKKLWKKGEKSGNTLQVKEILTDCDSDTLLIKVTLIGTHACHTGNKTCFFTKL